MDQYIGKFLGNRYEILERIGTGGMAVVYKAKCHWLNRFVAIKILKEDLAQDEEFRRRFREESQAVAMLSHPNIVAVYDVSRSEDSAEPDYIVMELIEGITLKQYMQKRGGKLNWKEALHFITQIMKGLSHAHGRGIIHRDIKPHNIMILRDGSVKVADFGIARLMSAAQNTMTQEALGSVHYISPEQARGSRIDARSDIYSAGVVLYEMLTGRLPYEGDSPVAVAIQHINSIPLSPRELEPSIPEAMEEITMKAMASDVEKRYLSAEAMLTDLEEFRRNPNISFDYTSEDLLVGEGEEPTQPIGAVPPPVVPVHTERYEEKKRERADKRRSRREEEEEEPDLEEGLGGGKQMAIIMAAVILCLVGVGIFLWSTIFSDMMETGATYQVPDVLGYTIEEARELPGVKENGFKIVEGHHVSSTVPVGHIVSQSPNEGDVVKAGAQEITVEISAGAGGLIMPDVYNKDRRVAYDQLTAMGLTVTIQEEESEDITENHVISQTPAKGETVADGEEVTIVVSTGRALRDVAMMPVTNMSLEAATKIITEDLGLRLGTVTPMPSELEEGMVCFQSIPPYTMTKEETVVDLGISMGVETVEPPDASQSAGPEQSAEPTPAQPRTSRKDVTVSLPDDRETVIVQVTVGGSVAVPDQVIDTRLRTARFTVEGSGSQEIVVYVDGVEAKRYTENFDG